MTSSPPSSPTSSDRPFPSDTSFRTESSSSFYKGSSTGDESRDLSRNSQLLGPRNARNSIRLSDIRSSSSALRPLPRTSTSRLSGSSGQFSEIGSDSSLRRSGGSMIYEPSTASVSRRRSKILEGFPKAHLKPPKQLHGREEDTLKLLTAVLFRVDENNEEKDNNNHSNRQRNKVVLVSGASGSGKTALVEEILGSKQLVATSKDGDSPACVIRGKFDYSQRQVPYAGITQALRQLCEHYKARNTISDQQRQELLEALGGSIDAVKQLLPGFSDLVDLGNQEQREEERHVQGSSTDNERPIETSSGSHLTEASQRFRFGIQNFLWTLATWNSPQGIVMFLDDLQFADLESFQLLESLMDTNAAPKEARLTLVGCYRDDEQTTMLTSWMDGLISEEEGDITRISLSNLSLEATNGLVADVLRMDIDDDKANIEELASVVHSKTLGNPFFVMEFLKTLQRSEILSFDIMKLSWSWNKDQLQEETAATDNVIEYMKRQMTSLPKDLCDFLPYAACLGSTFSSRQLDTVFTACQEEGIGWNVTTSYWLEYCVTSGFISPLEYDSLYRWAHDKVQEAAFSLLPPDEVESVQFHVGEILLENQTPIQTRENVLAVASLLIKGQSKRSDMDEQKCLEVAKVCLEAGHTLMISAAFSEAVIYLDAGIMFLPANHWEIDRVLSLELYTSAAESESLAGDGHRIEKYCYEVINQKNASMTEKFRAYDVLITLTWGKKNDYQGASDMAVHVLAELGCKLPKRMQLFHVLSGIIKMKKTMKKFGPDAILSHKEMTEYPKVQSMVMLDRLATVAYQLKSPYLPLAILKSFNWSIKYGISEYSPSAFALVALVLMAQLKVCSVHVMLCLFDLIRIIN